MKNHRIKIHLMATEEISIKFTFKKIDTMTPFKYI